MASDGSFFGGLTGMRMPETVMNSGPLPPLDMGGMPYGLNGAPDARINYGSSLLGDIAPYAYGEPSRLSTQSSYINIPNRIQKVVPLLYLPGTSETDDRTLLTHAVDDGDVCFALRDVHMKLVENAKGLERMYSHRNYHPFVNLATVNYLLAGLQINTADKDVLPKSWEQLFTGLAGFVDQYSVDKPLQHHKKILLLLFYMIETCFVPFGVAHGSEKQGGGHEGCDGPVTWASNFVTTMYIDGHVRNLANLWRNVDVSAGQHLVFQLRWKPLPRAYTLNHYQKATVRKSFTLAQRDALCNYYQTTEPYVLQLVPDVLHSESFDDLLPYWRIAIPHTQSRRYHDGETFHDDSVLLSGALLEGSFQPTFCLNPRMMIPGSNGNLPILDKLDSRLYGSTKDGGAGATRKPTAAVGPTGSGHGQQNVAWVAEAPFKRYARDFLNRPTAPARAAPERTAAAPRQTAAPAARQPPVAAAAVQPPVAAAAVQPLVAAAAVQPQVAAAAVQPPVAAAAVQPTAVPAAAPVVELNAELVAELSAAPEQPAAVLPAAEAETARKQSRKRAQASALGSVIQG